MATREPDAVWKALSDLTRRRLLDLLRRGPRTTGELASRFPVSRYAIMKHLAVLEDAGLVLARRRGRERWNHLNAVPIRRIYERWVSKYEGQWAGLLLDLKRRVETRKGDEGMARTTTGEINTIHIEQEVTIGAPPERVFSALTEVGAWWGAPYLVSDTARALVLEPKLAGRFYEDWGDGAGALYATVTALRAPHELELTGPIGMQGPVISVVELKLEATGKQTVMRLSHRAVGDVTKETETQYGQGWRDLLGTRLKAFVERGERMGLKAAAKR